LPIRAASDRRRDRIGGTHPVVRRQREAVADAHATLFGCVDHEEAAKRPECLPAEGVFAFLVDDQRFLAAIAEFGGRGEAGQPSTHNNNIETLVQIRLPVNRA
jgi:hypothetical protein